MLPLAIVLAQAAHAVRPELVALKATAPVTLDGKLEEPAWAEVAATAAFTQKFPAENTAPSERTSMRVLYDDEALYVAFECEQVSVPVVQRLTRRDRRVESDRVTIAIDSRRDGTTAFEFSVNASGVLTDSIRFNDTDQSDDWDENWDARVQVTDHGWSAEIKIPLRILRFSMLPVQDWGFQARRYISLKQETDEWAFIPRSAAGEVSRYGRLKGLRGLQATSPLELRPFVVGSIRHRDPGTDSLARGFDGNGYVGGDLKWHVTPQLTLDATIRTDIAQGEADQIIQNLTNYEIFLPEKRPFFLEGTDIFTTPWTLLYTRRIGRVAPEAPTLRDGAPYGEQLVDVPTPAVLYGAAKLVGQLADKWSVGTLSAVTGRNDVSVQDATGERSPRLVEPLTAYNVARVKRAVSSNGHVGALVTTTTRAEPAAAYPRAPSDPTLLGPSSLCPSGQFVGVGQRCFHDAYVGSVDGRWRSEDGAYAVTGQVVGSLVHGGPPRVLRDGTVIGSGDADMGANVTIAKEGGEPWVGELMYEGAGRKLDYNDVGYMRRQNEHHLDGALEYRTLHPWLNTVETHTRVEVYDRRNFDGLTLSQGYQVNTKWKFSNFWEVFVEGHYRTRRFDDREMGDGAALERAGLMGLEVEVQSDPRQKVYGSLWTQTQRIFDGLYFEGSADVTWRALPQLDLSVAPELVFAAGEPRYVGMGVLPNQYLFGKLNAKNAGATLRATYTFAPRLSLQAYAQLFLASEHYTDFSQYVAAPGRKPIVHRCDLRPADAPLTNPDVEEAALNVNLVLRWEYMLGSTLFLVYTRSQSPQVVLDPGVTAHLDLASLSRSPSTDTLLLKLTYWWAG
jgi:hypothetical protein